MAEGRRVQGRPDRREGAAVTVLRMRRKPRFVDLVAWLTPPGTTSHRQEGEGVLEVVARVGS